jgi:hypothetical protein
MSTSERVVKNIVSFQEERQRRKSKQGRIDTTYRACPHCGGKNKGYWDDGEREWFTTTVADPDGLSVSLYVCCDRNRETSCPNWPPSSGDTP